jgi:hypothetical protein
MTWAFAEFVRERAAVVSAEQLVAHAIGDYLLQSDWMALGKTSRSLPAAVHALTYALPFLLLTTSPSALAFIVATHFATDRWRLARYVVWAKNHAAPRSAWSPWSECSGTGYHRDRPPWMAVWLLIIADNVLHVLCNAFALRWLG